MKKRIFSIMAVLVMVLTVFAGTAQAVTIEPGIAAYTNIESGIDLEMVKSAFLIVEYETTEFFVGTLDLAPYEAVYNPLVLVQSDGLILAYYPDTDPAGKIVDVISKNLEETLLEKAVKTVATAAGVSDVTTLSISHYDFGNPLATKILLVAEYEPDGNDFTLQFEEGNTYYEKSYAFYRTFAPSFTIDTDLIDQVNFVVDNADFTGTGYYGTIFGHFDAETAHDFAPEELTSFAVQAGDHLGFGALAILYSGDADHTAADKDYESEITLADPGIDPTFDLIPSDFNKLSVDIDSEKVLDPTLSWDASTAPNYEYCIDTIDNSACDTEWIGTGSETSVDLSNLFYETTYYWQVRAINSDYIVEADGGAWWSFTTAEGVAPFAFSTVVTVLPDDLKESVGSLSKISMSWDPSYGTYYYEVCVDTTPDCVAPEVWHNVGLATTAAIGELQLDTTYYWQVRAVNDFGITEADEGWQSFTTRTFSKLRPLDGEVYNLTLPFKWEETPLATNGYEYCIDQIDNNTCDGEWKKVEGTSVVVNSKKDKLDAGTYFWQVRTLGSMVEADDSDWFEFSVLSRKDLRKVNLFKVSPLEDAVDQDTSGLELTWDSTVKTSQIHSFEYCFFPVDDTDTTPISDDDTCTYSDENWVGVGSITSATLAEVLANATTYYWQVRVILDSGTFYADNGDYWAFTTVAP